MNLLPKIAIYSMVIGTPLSLSSDRNHANTATEVPKIFSYDIKKSIDSFSLIHPISNTVYPLRKERPKYTLSQFYNTTNADTNGLIFNFGDINGRLYFGLIDNTTTPHGLPVYYKKSVAINAGIASVDIRNLLSGKYDISNWQATGKGTLGYRVANALGEIIYDGRTSFNHCNTAPHCTDCFIEGLGFRQAPTIHKVNDTSAVIAFETNFTSSSIIRATARGSNNKAGQTIKSVGAASDYHEIEINNLRADTQYDYHVEARNLSRCHDNKHLHDTATFKSSFNTSPQPGTRKPFVFTYASDSRSGQGGGERDIFGVNAYIMKKMVALSKTKNAAFFQFSGDMIDGRSNSIGEQRLQYRNWKNVVAPFSSQQPIYTAMGNHEGLFHIFDDGSKTGITVDRFPFSTESAEAIFSEEFVLPENGPISEDGSIYDPNPLSTRDFPPYKENVYSYTYDNIAMVVLNSNYLYSRSLKYWYSTKQKTGSNIAGGGLHGYIMDQQMYWLDRTLNTYQENPDIDHIFITVHTPIWPNGGHKSDAMWYYGSNKPRPIIAGIELKDGIIERRDSILEMVNRYPKVLAFLTGDEHNYARTKIIKTNDIHLTGTSNPLNRDIWQINNGSSGAPYYAKEQLPWSDSVLKFSTQYALVFIYVDGKNVGLEVIDPDTLSKIE